MGQIDQRSNRTAICEICGATFHPKYNSAARFCSQTCAHAGARTPLDYDLIRQLYVEKQLGGLTIAYQLSCSHHAIYRALHEMGIPLRSASETTTLIQAKANPEQRLAQVAAANEAARGRIKSFDELSLAAQTRYERQTGIGPHEIEFIALLAATDITFDQQTPCGTYNLDFTVSGLPLAIEIVTKNWTGRNRSLIGLRRAYILERWNLIEIKFRKEHRTFSAQLMNTLLPVIDMVRTDPSPLGRYWAMWPTGEAIRLRRTKQH